MEIESKNHTKAILGIINAHFDMAESRIDDVYTSYFAGPGVVLNRHWRHRKDVPSDLLSLPRHTWNFVAGKLLKKTTKPLPKTGKAVEVETIIADKLLDLKGLEQKIENYVLPYQMEFEREFTGILEQVPATQRGKFTRELERQVARLSTPIEGTREAVVFLLAGIIGKVFSEKVTFGSSIATGKAVATSIYISHLSWLGSLWAGIFGVPTWVAWAGAGTGILAAVIIAPMLTPFFELGINKFRAKKILRQTTEGAREKLTGQGKDAIDIAGKTAIYLQVLPDLIEVAKRTAKIFF